MKCPRRSTDPFSALGDRVEVPRDEKNAQRRSRATPSRFSAEEAPLSALSGTSSNSLSRAGTAKWCPRPCRDLHLAASVRRREPGRSQLLPLLCGTSRHLCEALTKHFHVVHGARLATDPLRRLDSFFSCWRKGFRFWRRTLIKHQPSRREFACS